LESGAADNISANGSFGFVDTSKMKLLVTCQHVWAAFDVARRENPQMKMCVCPSSNSVLVLDPIQPIDQDEKLDLASFDMEPFLTKCTDSKFFPLDCENVPRVVKGDALAFVGFPGRIQAQTSIGVKFWRRLHATIAYDVSDSCVYSDVSRLKSSKPEPESVRQASARGGISGSPCFLVRQNLLLQLVGFATSEALNVLRFTLARCLNADGTLKRRFLI
jgi:hypothetical protein